VTIRSPKWINWPPGIQAWCWQQGIRPETVQFAVLAQSGVDECDLKSLVFHPQPWLFLNAPARGDQYDQMGANLEVRLCEMNAQCCPPLYLPQPDHGLSSEQPYFTVRLPQYGPVVFSGSDLQIAGKNLFKAWATTAFYTICRQLDTGAVIVTFHLFLGIAATRWLQDVRRERRELFEQEDGLGLLTVIANREETLPRPILNELYYLHNWGIRSECEGSLAPAEAYFINADPPRRDARRVRLSESEEEGLESPDRQGLRFVDVVRRGLGSGF